MIQKGYAVAVVGATGAVGREMVNILQQRGFPVSELRLLASERSAGKTIPFKGRQLTVDRLDEKSFEGVQIALFSAGASVSMQYAPVAAKAGCIVIDNTSAFRMDPEVPLVVPEVNEHAIGLCKKKRIIANPNCSTIQMVVVLKPIHDAVKIKRVVVSTYQSVSGTGQKAIDELTRQSRAILSSEKVEPSVYPYQIAFNCLPHIDVFLDHGYTKEEMKMITETTKIMEDQSIAVTATTVRVPVYCGHSESVNIETKEKISAAEARELLCRAPGVSVVDDPGSLLYPYPAMAAGKDETFVGRIREDTSIPNGLNLWIVADNLRKGAALNSIQIAECLIDRYL